MKINSAPHVALRSQAIGHIGSRGDLSMSASPLQRSPGVWRLQYGSVPQKSCDYSYNVTACVSWNCILVPGLTTNVPAVNPCRACFAVLGGLPGWTLFVLTATLRPFTEIDVSSRVSGSDFLGFARDD
jgi:hypothetical protein